MSLPKVFVLVAIVLFIAIGVGAALKKGKTRSEDPPEVTTSAPLEVELDQEIRVVAQPTAEVSNNPEVATASNTKEAQSEPEKLETAQTIEDMATAPASSMEVPIVNRIDELFNKTGPKLPIVETITYQSRVGWQKGRPAWLSDYASHYQTSRHFIARSLNGKPEYFKQDVVDGDRFNVLRLDKNISFYLVIDTTRSKMLFYSLDDDSGDRILIKTYNVGLGRREGAKTSGSLTPLGKYSLGNKIAIYKPKMMGFHNGQKVEMMRIFGSRWIPFDKEISGTTAQAKGLGVHGVPWVDNGKGDLAEDVSSIGKFESDGCIRLTTADMEELFAIIITKPTTIELVKDFYDAKLPGKE